VDLSSSSSEEGLIADVSWDEEFARRLFGDLDRNVLGPPSDGKIIILSDFDEEEDKVHEEKTIGTEHATTSVAVNSNSASTASVDAPTGVKNDNSDDRTPDHKADSNSGSRDDAGLP
jgi:hypothetical protein